VMPVHRAGFIAVQVRPITCERDEVPHSGCAAPLPYGRGSALAKSVTFMSRTRVSRERLGPAEWWHWQLSRFA
jgi:hypothetical protein